MDADLIQIIAFVLFILLGVVPGLLKKNKQKDEDFSPPPSPFDSDQEDRDYIHPEEWMVEPERDPYEQESEKEAPKVIPIPAFRKVTENQRWGGFRQDDTPPPPAVPAADNTLLVDHEREMERLDNELKSVSAQSSKLAEAFPSAETMRHRGGTSRRSRELRKEIMASLQSKTQLQKGFLFSEIFGPAMGNRSQMGPRDDFWDR